MATFITLTMRDGQKRRYNVNTISEYWAVDGDTLVCFGDSAPVHFVETPDQIDAMLRGTADPVKDAADELLSTVIALRADLWLQIEGKHGAKVAAGYPSIERANTVIRAARGE